MSTRESGLDPDLVGSSPGRHLPGEDQLPSPQPWPRPRPRAGQDWPPLMCPSRARGEGGSRCRADTAGSRSAQSGVERGSRDRQVDLCTLWSWGRPSAQEPLLSSPWGRGRGAQPSGWHRMEGLWLSEAGWEAGPWAPGEGMLCQQQRGGWRALGGQPVLWGLERGEEQEARGYLGGWGVRCRAALPRLARCACGGLVVTPSTPGLDPGCQGLSGSVEVWVLKWARDQVKRGGLL